MTEAEKEQSVRITNVQRFCLHDGPGIRTTVFLKGCSIHCPWCANPENISYEIQPWRDPATSEAGEYGYDIALGTLYRELVKDKCFYLNGGGVTFSGGEPLLQIQRYEPLLRALKEERFCLAVETALFVDWGCVESALQYFDWWYVDMKILHPEQCLSVLGGQAGRYLENLHLVAEKAPRLSIRIPCCHGITDAPENMSYLLTALQTLKINEVELLEVHHLGDNKWASLGLTDVGIPMENGPAVAIMEQALSNAGISCKIMRA